MTTPANQELRDLIAAKIDEKMRSERMDDHFDGRDYADAVADALRAAGWRVEPPNASTIIRTGYGMTETYRKRLCQWARDNGLNPDDIPADARIEVGEDTITTEVTVRGEDGKPVRDSGTVLRERITVPLRTPWRSA